MQGLSGNILGHSPGFLERPRCTALDRNLEDQPPRGEASGALRLLRCLRADLRDGPKTEQEAAALGSAVEELESQEVGVKGLGWSRVAGRENFGLGTS